MFGPVKDPYFVLLILLCAAVITIGALVTVLRVRRAEFARLQNDLRKLSQRVMKLSQRVMVLEGAEQRRFVMEINSGSEGAEATHTTNGSDRLEAEGEAPGTSSDPKMCAQDVRNDV
jgi:hypothetical protein